jgi:hypothetical protein
MRGKPLNAKKVGTSVPTFFYSSLAARSPQRPSRANLAKTLTLKVLRSRCGGGE